VNINLDMRSETTPKLNPEKTDLGLADAEISNVCRWWTLQFVSWMWTLGPVDCVRDLDVMLDSSFSMRNTSPKW